MIEMKATQWLSRQQLEGHTVDELLQSARKILEAGKWSDIDMFGSFCKFDGGAFVLFIP